MKFSRINDLVMHVMANTETVIDSNGICDVTAYDVTFDNLVYRVHRNGVVNRVVDDAEGNRSETIGHVSKLAYYKNFTVNLCNQKYCLYAHDLVNAVFNSVEYIQLAEDEARFFSEIIVSNHMDTNIKNNSADNLEWIYQRENYWHSIVHTRLKKVTGYSMQVSWNLIRDYNKSKGVMLHTGRMGNAKHRELEEFFTWLCRINTNAVKV